MENAFFKEVERPTSTFVYAQCIQSYPLPLHRDGAEDPIAGFLRKFATLDWIHWECLFWHRYCAEFVVS